jgi:hypothetical protein
MSGAQSIDDYSIQTHDLAVVCQPIARESFADPQYLAVPRDIS